MCNLSEDVFRRGEERGFARGEERGFARGEERGETRTYARLIRNGIITEQQAAEQLRITVPELNKRFAALSA